MFRFQVFIQLFIQQVHSEGPLCSQPSFWGTALTQEGKAWPRSSPLRGGRNKQICAKPNNYGHFKHLHTRGEWLGGQLICCDLRAPLSWCWELDAEKRCQSLKAQEGQRAEAQVQDRTEAGRLGRGWEWGVRTEQGEGCELFPLDEASDLWLSHHPFPLPNPSIEHFRK